MRREMGRRMIAIAIGLLAVVSTLAQDMECNFMPETDLARLGWEKQEET